ncbi:MAG: ATP-dependent DNA helicase RecG [Planctomycetia bacterium]
MDQSVAPQASLSTPLERLPGVGTIRARRLAPLGLTTVRDALIHFPRHYKDFSGAHAFAALREGEHASLTGEVTDVRQRMTAHGRQMLTVLVEGQGGSLRAVWFNMPFMAKKFAAGMRVVLAGIPKRAGTAWEMTHPEVRWCAAGEDTSQGEFLPVYDLAHDARQSDVRLAVQAAIAHAADLLQEAFPETWLATKSLMPIHRAIREIHFPTTAETMEAARRRFIYQELFMLQLALRLHRAQQRDRRAASAMVVDARIDGRIRARLPFALTPDQDGVITDIVADIAKEEPMNRLLQGDVGSGKTAVAVYAMLAAVACGHQAALMAPTELLARQHMDTLERLLAGGRVNLELLVGGQTRAQRRKALDRIAAGTSQIVIGTQALVSGQAAFKSLGLVVIDEQHRFGVVQRATLQHGGKEPHVLVMTATPIPRTIAHAVYGDLDQSTIRTGPAGRQPVRTYRVGPDDEASWWDHVRHKLLEGRQGYVVVPAIEESKRGLATIASAFEELANGSLEAFRLSLVHGRLKPAEKQAIMEDFRARRLDVLVCTSVIEVGIDVPNATIMTILDADSFGLAQLHQLRGRVARGAVAGICGAVTASGTEAHPRVDAFVASTDGFELAAKDFSLRGPGELVGSRQSGRIDLYIADLARHPEIVDEARGDALDLFSRDPELADATLTRLKKLVVDRWGDTLGLGDVG